MRLDGPESSNIEDDTGRSGGMSLGGGGGGMIMMLLQLVASRFGIIGILVLALGYCALQSMGGGAGPTIGGNGGKSTLDPATKSTLAKILGSTEQVWGQIFQQAGSTYTPTKLAVYDRSLQSGCGAAQSAMGPFYCPTDKKIYLDPEFFDELSTKFNAPGDFPDGYVIAHEVGHHIQDLEGTLGKAEQAQASLGEAGGNKVQVGIELQADCYAGVWAKRSGVMEPGDLEEGLNAAKAIGDDTLQKKTQGTVVPDSFTHGTSAQRMEALKTGATTGDPAACAKYTAGGY